METLFLTGTERDAFEMLSSGLRDGWAVQAEDLVYEDTAEKRMIRMMLVRLHDPKLLALRSSVQSGGSLDQTVSAIQSVDLKDISEDDIAELFFALGPDILSRLILLTLMEAREDVDLERVAALTLIRHSMLAALHPVAV